MADDRRIEIEITADDEASRKLEEVADLVDDLDESVEVEVDADTRDAESRIERFERELEDLQNPDAIELRVEFRQQVIEGEIRKALRQLERLEDPVEIEVAQRGLEQAQQDLRDLADLAERKYEVEVEVDPKRTARRAAGDLEGLNQSAEGFQSGIPALRGFGDELGGVAQSAGVAGQAVGDLGDFALIAGERFGLQAGLASGLGAALGGAGLAAVVGGVLYEAYQRLNEQQVINVASAEELLSVQEALAEGNREAAARELAESYRDVIEAGKEFGFDAGETIQRITADVYGFAGANREAAESNVAGWEAYKDAVNTARGDFGDARQTFEDTTEAAGLIGAALGDNVAGGAEEAITALKKTEEGVILLAAAQQRLGEDATPEELIEEYGKIKAEVDAFAESVADSGREAKEAGDASEDAAERTASAWDAAKSAHQRYEAELSDVSAELAVIQGADDLKESTTEAWNAAAEGADDAHEKLLIAEEDYLQLKSAVFEYLTEVKGVPVEVATRFVADKDDVLDLAEQLRQGIDVDVRYNPRWSNGPPSRNPDGSVAPIPVSMPIGVGPSPLPAGLIVNVRTDAGMRQVDRAISRWRRVNGSG